MTPTGLVPLIRYRDPEAAIAWLGKAFAFEPTNVVRDNDGSVAYAELSYGRGIVMVGPVGDSSLDALLRQPDEIGGLGTQACYVAVENVGAHCDRARAAGAAIVLDVGNDGTGDRAYAARDPEGHIWNFGAYSPWRAAAQAATNGEETPLPRSKLQSALAASVAVFATVTAIAVFMSSSDPTDRAEARHATAPRAPIGHAQREQPPEVKPAALPPALTLQTETEPEAVDDALERAAHVRRELARTAAGLRAELDRERRLREAAEVELKLLRAHNATTQPQSGKATGGPEDGASLTGPNLPLPPNGNSPPTAPQSGIVPVSPVDDGFGATGTIARPTEINSNAADISVPSALSPADGERDPESSERSSSSLDGSQDGSGTVLNTVTPDAASIGGDVPAGPAREAPAVTAPSPPSGKPQRKPEQAQKASKPRKAGQKKQPKVTAAQGKPKPESSGDPFFLYD